MLVFQSNEETYHFVLIDLAILVIQVHHLDLVDLFKKITPSKMLNTNFVTLPGYPIRPGCPRVPSAPGRPGYKKKWHTIYMFLKRTYQILFTNPRRPGRPGSPERPGKPRSPRIPTIDIKSISFCFKIKFTINAFEPITHFTFQTW